MERNTISEHRPDRGQANDRDDNDKDWPYQKAHDRLAMPPPSGAGINVAVS